ncbi:MAG: asparagine synthase C-terminal domain-containing protein [Candidatus Thorarchaeota archaeon]
MKERISLQDEMTEVHYDLPNRMIRFGFHGTKDDLCLVENQYQCRLLIVDKVAFDCEESLEQLGKFLNNQDDLRNLPTMFVAIGVTNENEIRIIRSLDGVRPLYFADLNYGLVFSNRKKAIWAIGQTETESLNPGCMLIGRNGVWEHTQLRKHTLPKTPTKKMREDCLEDLKQKLHNSFSRFKSSDKCGVLFSGGVDSSLAAILTKNICEDTVLVSAASPSSKDFQRTREIARALSIDYRLFQFDVELVWRVLPEVIYAIETSNRMDVEIAIPFFLAASKAKEEGCKLLVSGQGPDELFAGYARYERTFIEKGSESVRNELWSDYSITHDTNIVRDVLAIEYHGVDSFFPYLDQEFGRSAFSTPVEFFFNPHGTPSRKIIFRDLARELGLREDIANTQKHATQYSSGSSKALQKAVMKNVQDAEGISRRESHVLVQNVLHTIAKEIGIPTENHFEIDMDMSPTQELIERVGRLPTSNLG